MDKKGAITATNVDELPVASRLSDLVYEAKSATIREAPRDSVAIPVVGSGVVRLDSLRLGNRDAKAALLTRKHIEVLATPRIDHRSSAEFQRRSVE